METEKPIRRLDVRMEKITRWTREVVRGDGTL